MTTMSSESVCSVARSWVDVGSFHTRLVVRFIIFTASVQNILDTPTYNKYEAVLSFGGYRVSFRVTNNLLYGPGDAPCGRSVGRDEASRKCAKRNHA
jgi:hypothetical protein